MDLYPVTYEADYAKERDRLTTFFRLIVAIPWLVVGAVYGSILWLFALVAWVVIIVTGRYPAGLFEATGGFLRSVTRIDAFTYLQTDAWPSFGIGDDPAYPVRIRYAPPAARQSRLKALFRLVLAVPLLVLSIPVGSLQWAVSVIAWLTIVFRGYQPAAIHNALAWITSWNLRVNAYLLLMRDEYPPVGDETMVEVAPPAPSLGAGEPIPALDPATGGPVDG